MVPIPRCDTEAMAHFNDLSFYDYSQGSPRGTKNVGWPQFGRAFETVQPSEETLELLWSFCNVAVMQTCGIHRCDLCVPPRAVSAIRGNAKLPLGSAEIRVLSKEGFSPLPQRLRNEESSGLLLLRKSAVPFSVYAAPNLVYHYVDAHHYKPPDEFLDALREGPRPPDEKYFQCLKELDLEWGTTASLTLGE